MNAILLHPAPAIENNKRVIEAGNVLYDLIAEKMTDNMVAPQRITIQLLDKYLKPCDELTFEFHSYSKSTDGLVLISPISDIEKIKPLLD